MGTLPPLFGNLVVVIGPVSMDTGPVSTDKYEVWWPRTKAQQGAPQCPDRCGVTMVTPGHCHSLGARQVTDGFTDS